MNTAKDPKNGLMIETEGLTLQQVMMRTEAAYIAQTLAAAGFNKKRAAAKAGVSYNRFLEKCARLDLRITCEAA